VTATMAMVLINSTTLKDFDCGQDGIVGVEPLGGDSLTQFRRWQHFLKGWEKVENEVLRSTHRGWRGACPFLTSILVWKHPARRYDIPAKSDCRTIAAGYFNQRENR
jgi:hypothetical protein